ncbi:hypothetical protein [Cellulomonas iranensis]|uniref:hypothetical protein n=1 Tax=Cellulomonas iranensis TaxID=76862 RepID=UPI0013D00A7D|nr:hypothetical protein [Cellulomonas iranensis]
MSSRTSYRRAAARQGHAPRTTTTHLRSVRVADRDGRDAYGRPYRAGDVLVRYLGGTWVVEQDTTTTQPLTAA